MIDIPQSGMIIAFGGRDYFGAMLTGQLSTFSYWCLDTFPLLATIG